MKDMVCIKRVPWKFILLSCIICSAVVFYLIPLDLILKGNFQLIGNKKNHASHSLNNSSNTLESRVQSPAITTTMVHPSITLFVRMAATLENHRYRYYCDLLRTTVLYWPPSYGKTVVVLDEESEVDYAFAQTITRLNKEHFPDYKLDVLYEPLPNDNSVLNFPGLPKPPGYNRQLWSSYFIDLFTTDSIVAWVDSDVAFVTPVTKSSIFDGTKLRVIGWDCSWPDPWVESWAKTTEVALGLPYVADFVGPFPIYIYRDTFTHCREHILKRFKTTSFEEAFKKFYHHGKGEICPVSTVLSYAWYFERDRYDWKLKICSNLTEYNKRLPAGHTIGPQQMEWVLSEPQTTFHVPQAEFLLPNILTSYCLSHEAAGNKLDICANRQFSLSDNFVLLHHNLERVVPKRQRAILPKPCEGKISSYCLKVLERHYKRVGLELKQNARKLDWRDLKTVEKLADEAGIKCKSIES